MGPSLSFQLLNTGSCREFGPLVFRGSEWRTVNFPATCALLGHPVHGQILFDTGYSSRFFEATQTFPERFYRWVTPVSLKSSAVDQLQALGISPRDVGHVIVSHFHADHIAGLKDFPYSTVVYDGSGLQALRRLSRVGAVRAAFLSSLVPEDLEQRSRILEAGVRCDLFGDKSLILLPLPGHAPGHLGALCRTANGPVLLLADAAWNLRELSGSLSLTGLSAMLHHRWTAYQETQQFLRSFLLEHPDVIPIPTHDAEAAEPWSRP